jgi:hypothetical protein
MKWAEFTTSKQTVTQKVPAVAMLQKVRSGGAAQI